MLNDVEQMINRALEEFTEFEKAEPDQFRNFKR